VAAIQVCRSGNGAATRLNSVLAEFRPAAFKTGMIYSTENRPGGPPFFKKSSGHIPMVVDSR